MISGRLTAAGGEAAFGRRVAHVSFLLGLVWDFLFHKCNEKDNIIITVTWVGPRGFHFRRELFLWLGKHLNVSI